jgi:hypothetical protein
MSKFTIFLQFSRTKWAKAYLINYILQERVWVILFFVICHGWCHLIINFPSLDLGLYSAGNYPFSYPEPFLRAVRRGSLAKSIIGYHKNMVRKQYPVLELANQMPVRIWIWPEPLVAPPVRRALGTRMVIIAMVITLSQSFHVKSAEY